MSMAEVKIQYPDATIVGEANLHGRTGQLVQAYPCIKSGNNDDESHVNDIEYYGLVVVDNRFYTLPVSVLVAIPPQLPQQSPKEDNETTPSEPAG